MDTDFLRDFRRTLDGGRVRLFELSDGEASQRRSPSTWSPKEIIGHLIDSAANNHARFVRAQATDDLVFDGYDQDAWVRSQRYNERRWVDLIQFWYAYNLHLANVMESADPGSLNRPRARHSLDRIAFHPLDTATPATLAYLMRDYVAHLKHHLGQIQKLS
jgi:DinB family protein